MSFMYKSMGAKHSNWQLSRNNQYVSYALLSLGGFWSHKNYRQNTQHLVFAQLSYPIYRHERLACLNNPHGVQLGTLT